MKNELQALYDSKVQVLLGMLKLFVAAEQELASSVFSLAGSSDSGTLNLSSALRPKSAPILVENWRRVINSISEAMVYENPYIWIMYKHLAYKDGNVHFLVNGKLEAQAPILTLQDLRTHCTANSHAICSKRFNSVNEFLRQKYGIDLLSDVFLSGSSPLPLVAEDWRILAMCQDFNYKQIWNVGEFRAGGWKVTVQDAKNIPPT